MSDSLTSDTPADDAAANAPEFDAAADAGSVNSPDVIPATRFNGLMSKYQGDKATWDAEREALRAEVESLRSTPTQQESNLPDELVDVVRELQAELQLERKGRAIERALEKHPGAKPLADLIIGSNPEEIEAVAKALEERLAGLIPAATNGDNADGANDPDVNGSATVDPAVAAAAAAAAAPVVGGAVTVNDDASADDAVAEAVKNGDFVALMAAKERQAREAQGADLTVG